ncbi:hypothetical protein DFQ28_007955 [Apophysomyces sp. BC1034]|nr:hypothetical protein DFQ29_006697 [Apophysomyces sp. BC1021]KAG0186364.1 hypothetical protein DFQ28_007955 [Apophysomyces sp. BC1034]
MYRTVTTTKYRDEHDISSTFSTLQEHTMVKPDTPIEATSTPLSVIYTATATAKIGGTTVKNEPIEKPVGTAQARPSMSQNKMSSAASWGMSNSAMVIEGLNTDFTFSPITLAPESTRPLLPASSMRALTAGAKNANASDKLYQICFQTVAAQLIMLMLAAFVQI